MKIHCQECGQVSCSTELLSGMDDGHGPRGVCPHCGADEEEFATVPITPFRDVATATPKTTA